MSKSSLHDERRVGRVSRPGMSVRNARSTRNRNVGWVLPTAVKERVVGRTHPTKCALVAALMLVVGAVGAGAEVASATPTIPQQVREILSGNLVLEASQQAAVKQLVGLGEPAGIAMAKYLPSKVTTVAITLRDAYVDMQEKASPGLRIGLASDDPLSRRVAMSFLSEIGSATDRDLFLSYLDDPDETLRTLAARGLVGAATFDDGAAQAALLHVLDATLPGLRKWSALALGTWGDEAVIGPLAARLEDGSWTVRWDAANGLVEHCKRGRGGLVRAAVEPLLSASKPRTRALAAYVLGKGGVADALPALRAGGDKETDAAALGYQAEALRLLEKKPSLAPAQLPAGLRDDPFVKWKAGN